MIDVCIIPSINHLLLPQSYLLNGSLNNADCPDTGHVFMAMLVFRSNAMILNQPVDRWSQATQAASGSAPLLGHMPLGRHVGGA